jgi:hypothetical protein
VVIGGVFVTTMNGLLYTPTHYIYLTKIKQLLSKIKNIFFEDYHIPITYEMWDIL